MSQRPQFAKLRAEESALAFAARIPIVLTLTLSVACAGGMAPASTTPPVATATPQSQKPADTEFDRELETLGAHAVRAPTGTWTSEIEGKAPPALSAEGITVSLESDIGAATPIRCTVVPERRDHGATVTNALQKLAAHVEVREVLVYDFEADERGTAIFVRATVALSVEGQTLLTGWKMMVARTADHSMLCTLSTAGYRKTFVRVAGGFARAMKTARTLPPANRIEVWRIRSEGTWVGHVRQRAYRDPSGGYTLQTWGTLMVPTSKIELSTSDFSEEQSLTAEGELLTSRRVEREGDGRLSHITLQRQRTAYEYAGFLAGSKQSGAIEGARFVNPDIFLRSARQRVAAGAPKVTADLDEYHPDLDPHRAFRVRYEIEKNDSGALSRFDLGPSRNETQSDTQGRLRQGKMRVGKLVLDTELVFEQGEL